METIAVNKETTVSKEELAVKITGDGEASGFSNMTTG